MTRMRMLISFTVLLSLGTIAGCLIPLPGGSGIRIVAESVPASEMPPTVEKIGDQALDSALEIGDLAAGALDPILGALLYQFVLRPLRRRRERKKDTAPTSGDDTKKA